MGAKHRVRAAGGLIVRQVADRDEVALVHRSRYDDWSLPKGKLDQDETWEEAALREVREETGLRCELEEELESTSYTDRKGRPKLVRYWRMRVLGGEFEPSSEVGEMRWVGLDEAIELTDYEHDRRLLAGLASNERPESPPA